MANHDAVEPPAEQTAQTLISTITDGSGDAFSAESRFAEWKHLVARWKTEETFKQHKSDWKAMMDGFVESPIALEVKTWIMAEWKLTEWHFVKWNKRIEVAEMLGKYPQSGEELVRLYCDKIARASVTLTGIFADIRGVKGAYSELDLRNEIFVFKEEQDIKINDKVLDVEIDSWAKKGRRECLYALHMELNRRHATDEEAEAEWERFIGIIDRNPDTRAMTTIIMKHFIWNTKQRLDPFDVKSTVNPIMPVLVGKTGNGKSTAIEWFLKPLERACNTTINGWVRSEFDKLTDENHYMQCATIPVIFLDEMAKLNVVDADKLKTFMTDDTVRARRFFTQLIDSKPKISQLIGTSNPDLCEIIRDTTSSRRFYKIDTPDDMKTAHPQWFTRIKWGMLWQSVNVKGPDPLTPGMAQAIFELQHNEQRKKNYVEEWLEAAELPSGAYAATDLYEKWYEWAEKNDKYHWQRASSTAFGRAIKGVDGVTKRKTAKGVTYDIVSSSMAIPEQEVERKKPTRSEDVLEAIRRRAK